jgi:SAM-dependent methyltransferase
MGFSKEITMSNKSIFTRYYHTNNWGSSESISGPGSTLEYTKNIRKEIPKMVKKFSIKTILDIPCGDWNWFKKIKFYDEVDYTGGDIVDEIVDANNEKYGNERRRFINIDITKDKLPKADLLICRACLYHFSYADIFDTLNNFLSADIKYILTDGHSLCKENHDIETGQFRLFNLELPPFNFSKPILYIDDWIQRYPVCRLGLWEKSMLDNLKNKRNKHD